MKQNNVIQCWLCYLTYLNVLLEYVIIFLIIYDFRMNTVFRKIADKMKTSGRNTSILLFFLKSGFFFFFILYFTMIFYCFHVHINITLNAEVSGHDSSSLNSPFEPNSCSLVCFTRGELTALLPLGSKEVWSPECVTHIVLRYIISHSLVLSVILRVNEKKSPPIKRIVQELTILFNKLGNTTKITQWYIKENTLNNVLTRWVCLEYKENNIMFINSFMYRTEFKYVIN